MHFNKEFKQKLSPANYTTYEMDIKKNERKNNINFIQITYVKNFVCASHYEFESTIYFNKLS